MTQRKMVSHALAVMVAFLLATPDTFARGARSASRGSFRGASRSGGGGWSNQRTSSGDSSSRTTVAQGRGGQTAAATRDVSRSGDTVTVDRNARSSTGASRSSQKQYEFDDGRVSSVSRDVQATNRYGQSASWEGKAERSGSGWEFQGEGRNRYGQEVEAKGYGARGPYGSGVVADVQGGRYGDRTVMTGRAYGGPVYAAQLPYGARAYQYHGRSYYGYGGYYYRPVHGFYYPVAPPWGYCCYDGSDMVGAIALSIAGASLLYSDGVYYEETQVEGETQYTVVAPPAGAGVPQDAGPADAATLTIAGTTYYYYGNVFYEVAPQGGFIVVAKPAGVTSVTALPADVKPLEAGRLTYLVSGGRYYMPYLDPSGHEEYIVVDRPAGVAPAGNPPAHNTAVTLTIPAGTALSVRLASDVSSANKAGDRFQGNLESDVLAGGQLVATRGARVYGRVAEAKAGNGMGVRPTLFIELTDIEVADRVLPILTTHASAQSEARQPGRKTLGGAALGAGIGAAIAGGEGAAGGAGIGAVAGTAAPPTSPGNQVAFAAGTAVAFYTAQALTVQKQVLVVASAAR